MVSPVDASEVRLTGENSYIRLSQEEGGQLTSRVQHWRVLLSPAGPGHALFLQSELTDNQVRIYADNIGLARWLQEEIESGLYAANGDQSIAVAEATFSRHGDVRSFSTEKAISGDTEISMTWYDFGEPFANRLPPGFISGLPHGVYNVIIPARRAQLVVNGRVAQGRPSPQQRNGHTGSSCSLAWSETWVRPR